MTICPCRSARYSQKRRTIGPGKCRSICDSWAIQMPMRPQWDMAAVGCSCCRRLGLLLEEGHLAAFLFRAPGEFFFATSFNLSLKPLTLNTIFFIHAYPATQAVIGLDAPEKLRLVCVHSNPAKVTFPCQVLCVSTTNVNRNRHKFTVPLLSRHRGIDGFLGKLSYDCHINKRMRGHSLI